MVAPERLQEKEEDFSLSGWSIRPMFEQFLMGDVKKRQVAPNAICGYLYGEDCKHQHVFELTRRG
jgi:hypothetical protein